MDWEGINGMVLVFAYTQAPAGGAKPETHAPQSADGSKHDGHGPGTGMNERLKYAMRKSGESTHHGHGWLISGNHRRCGWDSRGMGKDPVADRRRCGTHHGEREAFRSHRPLHPRSAIPRESLHAGDGGANTRSQRGWCRAGRQLPQHLVGPPRPMGFVAFLFVHTQYIKHPRSHGAVATFFVKLRGRGKCRS